ncbi:hypothetical protein J4711_13735 [Staphylococcus epidermidis]|nr:hypothetical protein [Staphylococcus epidermidis]
MVIFERKPKQLGSTSKGYDAVFLSGAFCNNKWQGTDGKMRSNKKL